MNLVGSRCTTSIFLMLPLMKKRARPRSLKAFLTLIPSAVMRTISRPILRHKMTLSTLNAKNTQKAMNTRKKVRSLPEAPAISMAVAPPTPSQAKNQPSSISRWLRGMAWSMMMVNASSCHA